MDLSVNEIIKVVKGRRFIKKDYGKIKGVSVDSRTIKRGELFFALKGERWDGHRFVKDAMKKSQMPVCISNKVIDGEYILVDNTIMALGELAKYWRRKVNTSVIAITGSLGKTTTKNIVGSILSVVYPTYISIGNYNNLIGVPLNIFHLNNSYKYAVLELGSNKKGEIRRLSEISSPDISLITNIGRAHLEFFGNLENVLDEKVSIAEYTKGPIFVNQDDEMLSTSDIKNKYTYGFNPNADYVGKVIDEQEDKTIITVNNHRFSIPFIGRGNLYNALSAIAVGLYLNISPENIQKGILNAKMEKGRLQLERYNDILVINDAYNANPESVENALSILEKFSKTRRIAILGDMLELGKHTEVLHREIGAFATDRVDVLIAVGNYAKWMDEEFDGEKYRFDTLDEAIKFIKGFLTSGDTVLIKGSRKMGMERIIEKVFQKEEDCSITYTT